jgi:hypothetical protein
MLYIVKNVSSLQMQYWSGLPPIIFGSASLLAGFVTCLVPDTADDSLPNTVEQAEALGENIIKCDSDDGEINFAYGKEDTGLNLVVFKERD